MNENSDDVLDFEPHIFNARTEKETIKPLLAKVPKLGTNEFLNIEANYRASREGIKKAIPNDSLLGEYFASLLNILGYLKVFKPSGSLAGMSEKLKDSFVGTSTSNKVREMHEQKLVDKLFLYDNQLKNLMRYVENREASGPSSALTQSETLKIVNLQLGFYLWSSQLTKAVELLKIFDDPASIDFSTFQEKHGVFDPLTLPRISSSVSLLPNEETFGILFHFTNFWLKIRTQDDILEGSSSLASTNGNKFNNDLENDTLLSLDESAEGESSRASFMQILGLPSSSLSNYKLKRLSLTNVGEPLRDEHGNSMEKLRNLDLAMGLFRLMKDRYLVKAEGEQKSESVISEDQAPLEARPSFFSFSAVQRSLPLISDRLYYEFLMGFSSIRLTSELDWTAFLKVADSRLFGCGTDNPLDAVTSVSYPENGEGSYDISAAKAKVMQLMAPDAATMLDLYSRYKASFLSENSRCARPLEPQHLISILKTALNSRILCLVRIVLRDLELISAQNLSIGNDNMESDSSALFSADPFFLLEPCTNSSPLLQNCVLPSSIWNELIHVLSSILRVPTNGIFSGADTLDSLGPSSVSSLSIENFHSWEMNCSSGAELSNNPLLWVNYVDVLWYLLRRECYRNYLPSSFSDAISTKIPILAHAQIINKAILLGCTASNDDANIAFSNLGHVAYKQFKDASTCEFWRQKAQNTIASPASQQPLVGGLHCRPAKEPIVTQGCHHGLSANVDIFENSLIAGLPRSHHYMSVYVSYLKLLLLNSARCCGPSGIPSMSHANNSNVVDKNLLPLDEFIDTLTINPTFRGLAYLNLALPTSEALINDLFTFLVEHQHSVVPILEHLFTVKFKAYEMSLDTSSRQDDQSVPLNEPSFPMILWQILMLYKSRLSSSFSDFTLFSSAFSPSSPSLCRISDLERSVLLNTWLEAFKSLDNMPSEKLYQFVISHLSQDAPKHDEVSAENCRDLKGWLPAVLRILTSRFDSFESVSCFKDFIHKSILDQEGRFDRMQKKWIKEKVESSLKMVLASNPIMPDERQLVVDFDAEKSRAADHHVNGYKTMEERLLSLRDPFAAAPESADAAIENADACDVISSSTEVLIEGKPSLASDANLHSIMEDAGAKAEATAEKNAELSSMEFDGSSLQDAFHSYEETAAASVALQHSEAGHDAHQGSLLDPFENGDEQSKQELADGALITFSEVQALNRLFSDGGPQEQPNGQAPATFDKRPKKLHGLEDDFTSLFKGMDFSQFGMSSANFDVAKKGEKPSDLSVAQPSTNDDGDVSKKDRTMFDAVSHASDMRPSSEMTSLYDVQDIKHRLLIHDTMNEISEILKSW